jgi:hypothetical protein
MLISHECTNRFIVLRLVFGVDLTVMLIFRGNRHFLVPYFYFLIIYFISRKARKGAMPLFFTTLEETKKHQRMDDVLIHEKMKI